MASRKNPQNTSTPSAQRRTTKPDQHSVPADPGAYEWLFASHPQPMWIYDRDTLVFLDVNRRAIQHYGYSRSEFMNMSFPDICPTEAVNTAGGNLEQHRRKDGSLLEVEVVAHALSYNARPAVLAILMDRKEPQAVEGAPIEAREFQKGTLDALTAHVAILDDQGMIVQVNAAWRQFGRRNGLKCKQYCVGANYLEICDRATGGSADGAPQAAQAIREVLAGKQQEIRFEYPCHSQRKKRWFSISVTGFKHREARWAVVIHENITERKLAEEALQRSEEDYRQLFESEPDAIFLIDNQTGQILQANRAASALYGYSQAALLQMKNRDLSAEPEETKRVTTKPHIEPDQVISIPLRWHRKRDGTVFPVEITGRFFLRDGRKVHTASIRDMTERRKAEEARLQTEQVYRQAITRTGGVPYQLDHEKNQYVFLGEGFEALTGFSPEQMTPAFFTDHVRRREPLGVCKDLPHADRVRLAREGQMKEWSEDYLFERADGGLIWLADRSVPVYDPAGRPSGSLGILTEITERKLTEEALRHNEAALRKAQQVAHVGSWVWHIQTNQLEWSDEMYRIFGIEKEGFSGDLLDVLGRAIHPDDRAAVESSNQSVIDDKTPIPLEYRILWPDGVTRTVWAEAGELILDERRRPIRLTGIVQDITERKRTEQALRESEVRYRKLLELAPIGIAVHSEGRIVFTNPAGARLLGYDSEEQIIGRPIQEIIHPDKLPAAQARIQRLRAGEEGLYPIEDVYLRLDGTPLEVEVMATPLTFEGKPAVQVIVTDITERKRTERALQENQAHIQRLLDQQTTVNQFALELGQSLDPQTLYQTIYQHVQELTDAWVFIVSSFDNESNMLRAEYAVYDGKPLDTVTFPTIPLAERGKGNQSQAIHTGQPYYVRDHSQAVKKSKVKYKIGKDGIIEEQAAVSQADERETLSALYVPIAIKSKVIGVMQLQSPRRDAYCDDDIRLLSAMANMAAMALQNAHLYQDAQQELEERKRAEQALQKMQELYRALFEQSPDAVFLLDLDGNYQEVNQRVVEMLGFNREEFLGMSLADTSAHPNDSYAVLRRLRNGERVPPYERIFRGRNGRIIPLEIHVTLVRDQDGHPLFIQSIARDITARKQTEEALRTEKEKLDKIAATVPGIICSYRLRPDGTTSMPYASPMIQAVYGLRPEEVEETAEPIFARIHPEDLERVERGITISKDSLQPWHTEYRFFHPDKGEIWIEGRSMPVREADGSTIWHGFITDVSERKREEAKTRRHLAELEALYENGLAVSRLLDPERIGHRIIETFAKHLSWHHVTIRLREREDDLKLEAFSQPGLRKKDRAAVEARFNSLISKVGQGLSGWVAQTGEPLRTGDVHSHPQYVDTHPGIRSGLYVPLKVGEHVTGCISVESEEVDAFTEQDERLLVTLANQAAIAFENAHLFQTVQAELIERKETERALRESEERFRTFIEQSSQGILMTDEQGVIIEWNPALALISGIQRQESIGRALWNIQVQLMPAENLGEFSFDDTRNLIQNALKTGHLPTFGKPIEATLQPPDGEKRTILQVAFPIKTAHGYRIGTMISDITQRKLVEARLRESEERYRTVTENTTDIVWLMDLDLQIIFCSPSMVRATGYALEELQALPLDRFLPPESFALVKETTAEELIPEKLAQTDMDVSRNLELEFCRKDGSCFWSENTFVLVRDDQGQPTSILGTGRDITARKRAEEALRRSERRLQAILDHASATVHIRDLDGRYLLVNNALASIFALQPEELIGKSPFDLLLSREAEEHSANDQAVLASGVPATFEETFTQEDGVHIYLTVKFPLRQENGEIYALCGISTDITEQKKAEEQLQLLSRAVEQSPASIILTDPAGNIEYVNQRFLQVTGYEEHEVIGQNPRLLKSGHTSEDEYKLLWETILAGKEWRGEFHNSRKDSALFWESVWIAPILGKDGRATHFLAVKEDITTRKEAELALRRINQELEVRVAHRTSELSEANAALAKAAKLKDEFLASMSHELRTPLTGVLGLTEALQRQVYGTINERQMEILHTVEDSGRHLLNLINDILDLSKIEAGRMELEVARVSVDDMCQASLRLVKQMAAARRQSVSFDLKPTGLVIRADARRLKQVLFNLLGNAIKFTPEGGELGLEVRGNPERQEIDFTIWDQGIGISEDDLRIIFQPFVQLDSSLARSYPGTGLGLSLARRLTELHGGRIEVASAVGQGSRFTVTIPWLKSETAPLWQGKRCGEETAPNTDTSANNRRTILLADDNEVNVQVVSDYLSTQGYKIILAHNGQQVLELVDAARPDLILMDIQMPSMDGLEAIRRIRGQPDPGLAKTPVIALTALAMPGDRERCLEAGANYYLSKPVSLGSLAEIIQTFLEHAL